MADSQISQTGPFFRKLSLFNATWFSFDPRTDPDGESAVLDFAQDAGVLVEILHRSSTWDLRAKSQFAPAKTWNDVLYLRKIRQKECIGVASVITFASSDFARPDLGSISVEGYVPGNEHIRLCSLKTLAALACPWIIPISPNFKFWRSHSSPTVDFARKTTASLTIREASQWS